MFSVRSLTKDSTILIYGPTQSQKIINTSVDLHFKIPLNYKTPPPELNYNPPPLNYETPCRQILLFGYFLVCVVCFAGEREKLQLLRPLQQCRERETAATTTASAVQRERNCSCYDRFSSAERDYCTTTVLLLYYSTILLYYCTTVLLYHYCTTTILLLYYYWYYYCTIIILYHRTTTDPPQ